MRNRDGFQIGSSIIIFLNSESGNFEMCLVISKAITAIKKVDEVSKKNFIVTGSEDGLRVEIVKHLVERELQDHGESASIKVNKTAIVLRDISMSTRLSNQ